MLECKIEDNQAIIILQRSPANAFNLEFLRKLYRLLKKLEKNRRIHTVIIESKYHRVFSSGLDLFGLIKKGNSRIQSPIIAAVFLMHKITKKITRSKKIYIAALNGPVIGSAVSLAMACDFRCGDPTVWFWIPDPLFGGLLADGGIDLLVNHGGKSVAGRLCLTNERINSTEIKNLGLADINTINSKEAALKLSKQLSKYSYQTLWQTKSIINKRMIRRFAFLRLLRICSSKELMRMLRQYVLKEGQT